MISEQAVQIMEEYADDAAKMLAMFREMGRERGELEGFESSWRALIEVARLLNSDARLRDALGEARDRAAGALSGIQVVNLAAAERCAECGDLTLVLVDGSPVCEPCFDAANTVNLAPVEHDRATCGECIEQPEPDLAPSDAQDEAGEVTP